MSYLLFAIGICYLSYWITSIRMDKVCLIGCSNPNLADNCFIYESGTLHVVKNLGPDFPSQSLKECNSIYISENFEGDKMTDYEDNYENLITWLNLSDRFRGYIACTSTFEQVKERILW